MISWRKSLQFVHLSLTGQHAKADAVQRGLHHPLHHHAGNRRSHLFQGDLTALLIRLTHQLQLCSIKDAIHENPRRQNECD